MEISNQKKLSNQKPKARANRTGRSSTILTGRGGLEDDDSTIKKKTLLGG